MCACVFVCIREKRERERSRYGACVRGRKRQEEMIVCVFDGDRKRERKALTIYFRNLWRVTTRYFQLVLCD